MIDENPDQPETCEVQFEVKTNKICNPQQNIPVDVLKKDLLNYFSDKKKVPTWLKKGYKALVFH